MDQNVLNDTSFQFIHLPPYHCIICESILKFVGKGVPDPWGYQEAIRDFFAQIWVKAPLANGKTVLGLFNFSFFQDKSYRLQPTIFSKGKYLLYSHLQILGGEGLHF